MIVMVLKVGKVGDTDIYGAGGWRSGRHRYVLKSCFVVDLKYTKETRCPNVSERVSSVFNLPL
jgi:hypothetical protein